MSWFSISDVPTPINESVGVVADSAGSIYVLGGYSRPREFAKWDGSSWRLLSYMPTDHQILSAAIDTNDNIYALGDVISPDTFDRWDGSSWTNLPDIPTSRGGTLGAASDSDDNIYAIGGEDSDGNSIATVEQWDGSSWTNLPDMPTARNGLSATSDSNGNIYAIGGSGSSGPLATVEKWDGSSWSSLPDMPTARTGVGSTSDDNGNIYAVGGNDGNNSLATVEKWDGSSWSSLPDMPTVKGESAVAFDGTTLYAFGDVVEALPIASGAKVTWERSSTLHSAVDGQRVYRSSADSPSFPADYTEIATVGDRATTYIDTGVSSGGYTYAVTAFNAAGESSPTTIEILDGETVTYTYTDGSSVEQNITGINEITIDYIDGAGGESRDSSVSGGNGGRVENVVADVSNYDNLYIWVSSLNAGRYPIYDPPPSRVPPLGGWDYGYGSGTAEVSVSNTDYIDSDTEPFIAAAGGGGGAGGSSGLGGGDNGARQQGVDYEFGQAPPLGGTGGAEESDGGDGEGAVSGHGSAVPIVDSGTTITGGGAGDNTDGEIQISYATSSGSGGGTSPPDPPSNLTTEVQ